jgi:hypothetical protein
MDTRAIGDLTTARGPFASVHFDDSHHTEDAAKRLRLRVKEITVALADQGADEPTVEALVRAIEDAPPPVGESGRSLIAAHGEVLLDEHLAGPPATQVVRYSDLPYLVPLASHAAGRPPYLVVVADRAGAEITAYGEGTPRTESANGHPMSAGDTSYKDLQSRAEETAKQNLEAVARRVAKTAERAGAELIVLAGEVQARTALHDLLPERVRRVSTAVEGGSRAPGSSRGELDRRVAELLMGRRLSALDDVAERFRAETGRGSGLAVSGLAGVTAALAEGNVETLLVGEPGNAVVYTGPEPGQLGTAKPRLDALGVPDPSRHRADEAVPYAAFATGAELVVMDERLRLADGFGALLRHS